MIYIDLLKNIWSSVYDPRVEADKTIEKFFHQDYEQCINGITLNRTNYIHHVIER